MSGRKPDRNRSTPVTGPWDLADAAPSAGIGVGLLEVVIPASAAAAGGGHKPKRLLPTNSN
jgi:hypothetical protein